MTTFQNTKLTPVGDGLALLIDKSILERLGINEATPLCLQTDGRALLIYPPSAGPISDEEFKASMQKVNLRYEATFRKLAE